MVQTLLVDNYDSFTYNLYSVLSRVNGVPPVVVTNDTVWDELGLTGSTTSSSPPARDAPTGPATSGSATASSPTPGSRSWACASATRGCATCSAVPWCPHRAGARPDQPDRARRDRSVRRDPVPVRRGPLPLADRRACPRPARRHGLHRRRAADGGRAPEPAAVGSAIPSRIDLHLLRHRTARQFPGRRPGPHADHRQRPAAAGTRPTRDMCSTPVLDFTRPARRSTKRLFAGRRAQFWLDGSVTTEPGARFTVMGDASGPLSEFLTYGVAETLVVHIVGVLPSPNTTVPHLRLSGCAARRTGLTPRRRCRSTFTSDTSATSVMNSRPKRAVTGPHLSLSRRGPMVFADRAVVLDHEAGRCYLLVLPPNPTIPLQCVVRRTAAALAGLAGPSSRPEASRCW